MFREIKIVIVISCVKKTNDVEDRYRVTQNGSAKF
jgi:hypothetical protein